MRYDWKRLYSELSDCRKCGLCEARYNIVIGDGNPHAKLMFIGEGPGRDEDLQGIPFVGAAGKLLDKMLRAIDIERQDVYIANVVKCRPPNNRVPTYEEASMCLPYLRAQYALVRPEIVVCLGATAARNIIDKDIYITRDRGRWIEKNSVWFMATYHPAALLRDESKKRDAWEDLKSIKRRYDSIAKQQNT